MRQAQKRDTNIKVAMPTQYQYIGFMQVISSHDAKNTEDRAYYWHMPRTAKSPRSEVGQRMSELRQVKGLTQKQLAEKIGVSQQDIAYWERQAPAPRGEVLPKLAEVLEVSIDELMGMRQPKRRNEAPKGRLNRVFEAAAKLPRRQQQKIVELLEPFVREHATAA
jgi:transcriptional regulator with XRE-family HTH domain